MSSDFLLPKNFLSYVGVIVKEILWRDKTFEQIKPDFEEKTKNRLSIVTFEQLTAILQICKIACHTLGAEKIFSIVDIFGRVFMPL